MHVRVCVCMCMRVRACTYVSVCAHVHACVCVHVTMYVAPFYILNHKYDLVTIIVMYDICDAANNYVTITQIFFYM